MKESNLPSRMTVDLQSTPLPLRDNDACAGSSKVYRAEPYPLVFIVAQALGPCQVLRSTSSRSSITFSTSWSCLTSVRAACQLLNDPRNRASMDTRLTKVTDCNHPSMKATIVIGIHNRVHQPWNALRTSGRPKSANTLTHPSIPDYLYLRVNFQSWYPEIPAQIATRTKKMTSAIMPMIHLRRVCQACTRLAKSRP